MFGRRLLDAAAVLKASRAVASKHLFYRRHQLDTYNRTSTLARAIKNQTSIVTLTLRAASALAERFNGQSHEHSTTASHSKTPNVPSAASVDGPDTKSGNKQGLEQDHFYKRSEETTTANPSQENDLNVKQEQAKERPLRDGSILQAGASLSPNSGKSDATSKRRARTNSTQANDQSLHPLTADQVKELQRESRWQIPSQAAAPPPTGLSNPIVSEASENDVLQLSANQDQDVFHTPSPNIAKVISGVPRMKIPKTTKNVQEGDPHVHDEQLDQDVFYSSASKDGDVALPSAQAIPEQNEISEDMYSEIFQSPKVAEMMKGQPNQGRPSKGLDLVGTEEVLGEKKKAARKTDRESFSERDGSQTGRQFPKQSNVGSREDSEQTLDHEDARELAQGIAKSAENAYQIPKELNTELSSTKYEMRESRVPSSRFGRLWQYGGLATSMALGAVGERFRRATTSDEVASGSLMLSATNMERLVAKLSKMRGAALKLGQMMSFQDSKMLPGPINEVLQRVQDSADYMPASQRNRVLVSNLGSGWRDLFSNFDEKPIAAASIGQVHSAILRSNNMPVAIKVQYPGVANSIDSDLNNLSILLTASRLLPKGLYLDKTIANARTELAWECDYVREAEASKRFQRLLRDEADTFVVPEIYDEASGPQVLTMEMMGGTGVTKVKNFTQDQKDWIGTQILRLCLREITEFKYMQTDPNWTNFLFNAKTNRLELLDFGASREYPERFILPYIRILLAASRNDRSAVRDLSIELGYLTGHESNTMLNAHINSILILAEPFSDSSPEIYDYRHQTITDRVRALIPIMVRERLAPPPEETYSLHRKLSGAFLLCARLGSRVKCREMFSRAMAKVGVA